MTSGSMTHYIQATLMPFATAWVSQCKTVLQLSMLHLKVFALHFINSYLKMLQSIYYVGAKSSNNFYKDPKHLTGISRNKKVLEGYMF
jgi:hypothetical protein